MCLYLIFSWVVLVNTKTPEKKNITEIPKVTKTVKLQVISFLSELNVTSNINTPGVTGLEIVCVCFRKQK